LLLPSIATFFVNAALLPSPFLLLGDDAAWPINGAHWSITFEVFANIAYATVLFRLGGRSLYALIAVCAFFLLAGILVRGSYDVGWRLHQFHLACIRTAFPFLAGVAVCRLRRKYLVDARIKQQYGFILICVLIGFLAMPGGLMPRVGFQSVFVVIVVPVLVLLGSCVRVDENYGGVCRFLGSISFPLYAVHQPILKVVNFARGGLAADAGADLFSAFVGAVTSIAVALLLLYWLDEPVKSFMRAILLKNGTRRMVHGRSA
jgi:peptidoglycan/LPS O-acetylase OafA/YrhL